MVWRVTLVCVYLCFLAYPLIAMPFRKRRACHFYRLLFAQIECEQRVAVPSERES